MTALAKKKTAVTFLFKNKLAGDGLVLSVYVIRLHSPLWRGKQGERIRWKKI
jgi:hypothetical protein